MKVLIIPDKFKGSLTAEELIKAIKKGIYRASPDSVVFDRIASDGGDGFLTAVERYLKTDRIVTTTTDPLGRTIEASFLMDFKNRIAYIELAEASGLALLKTKERAVMHASTWGTGIQIREAIMQGARTIYIGLGGSATTDGGIGIAKAMGYTFRDKNKRKLKPKGESLTHIAAIEFESLREEVAFFAVNDVDNPLFGKNGAAYVYGAQKGASQEEIMALDTGLQNLDAQVKSSLGKNCALRAGAGAAGGAAYGLQVFLNASFIRGVDFVLNLAQVENLIRTESIDLIITGEGKIDNQTKHGKFIYGIGKLGKRHQVPVIGVCGISDISTAVAKELGLTKVLEIRDKEQSLAYNMKYASTLVEEGIYRFFKSTLAGK